MIYFYFESLHLQRYLCFSVTCRELKQLYTVQLWIGSIKCQLLVTWEQQWVTEQITRQILWGRSIVWSDNCLIIKSEADLNGSIHLLHPSIMRVLLPVVALANALRHQLNPEIIYSSPSPPAKCTSGLSTTSSLTLQNFPLSCLLITQSFYRQHLCFKLTEAPGADSSRSSGSFLVPHECWLFK